MQDILKKLAEISERAEKATPGPWKTEGNIGDFYVCFFEIVDHDIKSAIFAPNAKDIQLWTRNVPFIAHARTDIPALVEALKVAVENLEEAHQNEKQCLESCWSKNVKTTQFSKALEQIGQILAAK